MTKTISFDNIKQHAEGFNNFDNEYILFHISQIDCEQRIPESFRIDSLSIYLCVRGSSRICINCEEYELTPGTMMFLPPEAVIETKQFNDDSVEAYALLLTSEFAHSLNFDLNAIDYRHLGPDQSPVLKLTPNQQSIAKAYFDLIRRHASENIDNVYTRNVGRSLISAVIYQIMAFNSSSSGQTTADDAVPGRRSIYVHEFMDLLRENYRSERTINFYASKLFISPKYLSMVLKDATGFSATDWIDRFVIMEAKNLLRYSGKNIQQIAYELNFANQSSFGKYFKLQTGQSPSEFRKS